MQYQKQIRPIELLSCMSSVFGEERVMRWNAEQITLLGERSFQNRNPINVYAIANEKKSK